MGRDAAARRSARGGDEIPAQRSRRSRVATGAGAAIVAAALAGWPVVDVAERPGTIWGAATAGAVGIVLIGGGLLLRLPAAVTGGLALIGGEYGAALAVEDEPLDRAAPVYAALLFLAAELAWWSLELRERIAGEAGSQLRRLAFELALAVGAFALGGALLAAVDLVRVEGLLIVALGAAAAAAALSLVLPRRA